MKEGKIKFDNNRFNTRKRPLKALEERGVEFNGFRFKKEKSSSFLF